MEAGKKPEVRLARQVVGHPAPADVEGRIEFIGKVAPAAIRSRYIDKSVANYFAVGAQNPCKYVNC